MAALSDIADWWDEQKKESEEILTEWVQENPDYWGRAAAIQTVIDLGSGLVDVLRFGEGFAEGGVKGVGSDLLRLLVIVGPLGRAGGMAARYLRTLMQTGRIRFAVQVAGVDGPCTFQAVNNAVSITKGKNLFVTVSDIAEALGKKASDLKPNPQDPSLKVLGAWVEELIPTIKRLGSRVKEVHGLKSIGDVVAVAKRESGPVIFAIRATVRTVGGATEELLHSVVAMRVNGVVKFADYGGKYVASLEELVNNLNYGRFQQVELLQNKVGAAIIDGARLTGEYAAKLARGSFLALEGVAAIQTPNGVEFALPVNVVTPPIPPIAPEHDPVVLQGSFESYKERAKGRTVIRLDPIYISAGRKKAPPASYLTGVQFRLNALGFAAGPVDGIMGPITDGAVRRIQKAYPPLKIDGVPGPLTQAKLAEVAGY